MLLMALTPLTLQTVHADEPQGADIEFATKLIDLGTLSTEDDVQVVRLAFTNTGDLPLVVTEVRTSCSCTTVEYDRRSRVMPGERGTITVRMNPESAPTGSFSRVIAVHSTALSGTQHITLKAEIDEARSERSNQAEDLAEVIQTVPPNALFRPVVGNSSEQVSVGNRLAPDGAEESHRGEGSGYNLQGTDQLDARLQGRGLREGLPRPSTNYNTAGTVALYVTIDSEGNVTTAEVDLSGTTTSDATLHRLAIEAARRAKFRPSSCTEQGGRITYNFRLH